MSKADEIKKLKELLDSKAISEEEYQRNLDNLTGEIPVIKPGK